MRRLLGIIQRRRLLVTLPFWLARIQAWFLDLAPRLTRGLVGNGILTRDQVRLLAHDNVVLAARPRPADLGVEPTAMDAILETYLYAYRPHGQFDAITDSAKNLRA